MSNKISVIMPVYNTEAYLPRAVGSVIKQTYSDWELILVDDGSLDNCPQMCDDYSRKDSRIITIHKENGGQGRARNLAIEKCSGDYVMFLDSDDWIDQDTMQFLLDAILEYKADVIECGCRSVSSTGQVDEYLSKPTIIMNATECIDHLQSSDDAVGPGACSKLFKAEVVKYKRFPAIRAYEDYQFIYDLCVDIKKYVHVYVPKWNYFHRENSTMTSAFNLRTVALADAQTGICNILKEKGTFDQFQKAQKSLSSKQFYILYELLSHSEIKGASQEAQRLLDDILSLYTQYLQNPYMGKNKLMLRLIRYMPRSLWYHVLKYRFR